MAAGAAGTSLAFMAAVVAAIDDDDAAAGADVVDGVGIPGVCVSAYAGFRHQSVTSRAVGVFFFANLRPALPFGLVLTRSILFLVVTPTIVVTPTDGIGLDLTPCNMRMLEPK